jgi:monofunctional biosynthetic peptidoglycan transglycosylase
VGFRSSRPAAAKVAPKRRLLRKVLRLLLLVLAGFYGWVTLSLIALRWVDPPATAVQIQRRVESWFRRGHYQKRYTYVPLARISPGFQHAVVAAEDSRFFTHHGFDWEEIKDAVDDQAEEGRLRGASTIDQQLVKNLFLTNWRSPLRKAVEFTLVPLAEVILGKRRILELYLNVAEWGPGVYGAEAAARYHYGVPAAGIGREQGARLAAILPAPRRRKPARMNSYSSVILERMQIMGW